MQTKRDQLHAYMCLVGRVQCALIAGEPDWPETPMRRSTVATYVGAIVAIILVAGFGIFGLIKPGGKSTWRTPGTIVLEKDTTARFVYLDGKLWPVLNEASARLILGAAAPIVQVSRTSLAGVPLGYPIGIPGAPESLPAATHLNGRDWMICGLALPANQGSVTPQLGVAVTIELGPPTTSIPPDNGLLLRTPDGVYYLVWHGVRHRILGPADLVALGYGGVPAFPVANAWVNSLPPGSDLKAPAIDRAGEPGPPIGQVQTRYGQVFTVHNPGTPVQFLLLTPTGLRSISQTMAGLVLASPSTAIAYPGRPVEAISLETSAAAQMPIAPAPWDDDIPPVPPTLVDAANHRDDAPCVQLTLGGGTPASHVILASAAAIAAAGNAVGDNDPRTADLVAVRAGTGLIALATPAPGVTAGTRFLITETGIKYPLPSDNEIAQLGYSGVPQIPVPSEILAFLPTGPTLDPNAAVQVHPGTSSAGASGAAPGLTGIGVPAVPAASASASGG